MDRYGVGHSKNIKSRGEKPGFTIVELLIVVVVIAILAAITIVAFSGIRQRAETSAKKSELSQLQRKIQTDVLKDTGQSISIKQPIIRTVGVGTVPLVEPLVNAKEITLYGVFDANNNIAASGWSAIVALFPHSADNGLRLRTGAANSSTARGYYATTGETNRDVTINNVINNSDRHVGWIATNDTTIYTGFDTQPEASATLASHTGWNFTSIGLSSAATHTAVAALVFAEYHDAATRAQVSQWLAKEYAR